MSKEQIRKMISEKKQNMTEEEVRRLSEELTRIFCSLEEFQRADCLFAYCSFNQEVRTGAIIRTALETGKRVAVPKVLGDRLEFRYIRSEQDLEISSLGIPEPKDGLETADGREEEILMLMPGLAFDRTGARVGYGKGLYDRYLAEHAGEKIIMIALCYDFQLLEHIETEPFDKKADRVLTPAG
ncbi:MAG: 5-formyltetrahydrofolate cyclo-ligase, partial [Parasporobacterium sp.]|nr:5-formyltetrahydrofolate cyclo-ligase [Parasporobacterium sp.]